MITFEIISSIDEEVFNRLYDESLSAMEAGSFPFHAFPQAETADEKRALIREIFQNLFVDENKIALHVRQDDRVLMLSGGTLVDGHFHWTIGLMGTDVNGSKSWLYHPEYSAARDQFWVDNNISTFRIETMGPNTEMHDHIVNAKLANTVVDDLESESKEVIENVLTGTDLVFTVKK